MSANASQAKKPNQNLAGDYLESFFWWLFLVFLVLFSIISQRFDSSLWQFSVSVFYVYFAAYAALVASAQLRINVRAFKAAAPVIAVLAAIALWLYLQTILPFNGLQRVIEASWQSSPPWFQPSTVLSVVPERTHWLAQAAFFCFCWFTLCLCQIHKRQRLKQLLWCLWWLAVFHAVTALLSLKAGFYLFDPVLLDGHFDAARGWFVNRNHFAAMLVATASSGSAMWAYKYSKYYRLEQGARGRGKQVFVVGAWLLSACIVIIALVLGKSRAGLLAPVLCLIIFAVIAALYGQFRVGTRGFLLAIGCSVLLGLLLLQMPLGQRLLEGAFSIGERGTQWQLTWQAIQLSPWVGFGGGSYGTIFQIFRDHAELRDVVYNQSHNEYLHVWLEQGLIGLCLWLVLIAATIRYALVSLRGQASSLVRITVITASIGFGAALLQAGVDFNLQLLNLRCVFLLLTALIFTAPNIKHRAAKSSFDTVA